MRGSDRSFENFVSVGARIYFDTRIVVNDELTRRKRNKSVLGSGGCCCFSTI